MIEQSDYLEGYYEPVFATRWQFTWLCGLILSFCYGLPLVEVTTMARVNPKLFDIFFVVGMFTVFPNLPRIGQVPTFIRVWAWLVVTFCVCALIWFPQFPWFYGKFTIFYALKYLEGLLAIYMVARITLTSRQKKILQYMVVIGGMVVALYAIPEYIRGGTVRTIVASAGKEITVRKGVLTSSLSKTSYLHVALFSAMASVMTIALFPALKSAISRLACLGLGLFISWPALACGGRAGPVGVIMSWGYLFLVSKGTFKTTTIILMILLVGLSGLYAPRFFSLEYLAEKSLTVQRFIEGEESEERLSILDRLTANWYDLSLYRWQGWRIPFIGGGFYAVPHTLPDGTRHWRLGYGIHNAYLFALEQGGVVAFVLFIAFMVCCWKALSRVRKSDIAADIAFVTGMQAFFFSLLFVAFSGLFWINNATGDFCSHLIILLVIAAKTSTGEVEPSYGYEADYNNSF